MNWRALPDRRLEGGTENGRGSAPARRRLSWFLLPAGLTLAGALLRAWWTPGDSSFKPASARTARRAVAGSPNSLRQLLTLLSKEFSQWDIALMNLLCAINRVGSKLDLLLCLAVEHTMHNACIANCKARVLSPWN